METSKSLKLQSLQNRAVRALTQSSYDADTSQLIKKLGWDNLENRRQNLKAEMVYKSLNSLKPSYLSSKFIQRSDMVTKKKIATVMQSSGTVCPKLSGKQNL